MRDGIFIIIPHISEERVVRSHTVLAHSDCYTGLSQTGWLKNNRQSFLTVLGAGSPRLALGDLVSGEDTFPLSLEVPSCSVLTQKRGLCMFVSFKVLTVCDTKTLVSIFQINSQLCSFVINLNSH